MTIDFNQSMRLIFASMRGCGQSSTVVLFACQVASVLSQCQVAACVSLCHCVHCPVSAQLPEPRISGSGSDLTDNLRNYYDNEDIIVIVIVIYDFVIYIQRN